MDGFIWKKKLHLVLYATTTRIHYNKALLQYILASYYIDEFTTVTKKISACNTQCTKVHNHKSEGVICFFGYSSLALLMVQYVHMYLYNILLSIILCVGIIYLRINHIEFEVIDNPLSHPKSKSLILNLITKIVTAIVKHSRTSFLVYVLLFSSL